MSIYDLPRCRTCKKCWAEMNHGELVLTCKVSVMTTRKDECCEDHEWADEKTIAERQLLESTNV
jgi:hypothetical protein